MLLDVGEFFVIQYREDLEVKIITLKIFLLNLLCNSELKISCFV
jgi:hypothetical protein